MPQEKLPIILSKLRASLEYILGEKLEDIYIYGSQARGDAQPHSDIDEIVIIKGDFDYFDMVKRSGQIAADLSLEYETVISLAFTSKENFEHKMNPFLMNVRHKGIAV